MRLRCSVWMQFCPRRRQPAPSLPPKTSQRCMRQRCMRQHPPPPNSMASWTNTYQLRLGCAVCQWRVAATGMASTAVQPPAVHSQRQPHTSRQALWAGGSDVHGIWASLLPAVLSGGFLSLPSPSLSYSSCLARCGCHGEARAPSPCGALKIAELARSRPATRQQFNWCEFRTVADLGSFYTRTAQRHFC